MELTTLDLNEDLTYSTGPVSPLPRIWIGFLLAFGFLVAEIVELAQGNEGLFGPYTLVTGFAGWFYWLFCVHRIHKILNQISGKPAYPLEPGDVVIRHFVPVYNLYWIVHWSRELSAYLKERTSVRIMSGTLLGLLFLLSVLLRMVDGFIGLSCIFGLTLYISRKVRQATLEREQLRNDAEAFA